MGRYLIWVMAYVGYAHALDTVELPVGLHAAALVIGFFAYFYGRLKTKTNDSYKKVCKFKLGYEKECIS